MAATERRASGDPGRVGGGESERDEEKETERDRKRESERGWREEEGRECKTCVPWRRQAAGLTQGVVKLNKGLKGRP